MGDTVTESCRLCGRPIAADCPVVHPALCCDCEDRRAMKWMTVADEAACNARLKATYAQFDREAARRDDPARS